MQKARARARAAFESAHYDGQCTVIEHQEVTNERSKLTNYEDHAVLEDQECHLSYAKVNAAIQSESAAAVTQIVKLFISPDVEIKPGSKIVVTQAGRTETYTHSGIPAVYETHQEIILDPFERWS